MAKKKVDSVKREKCPCCNNSTFIQFWIDKEKLIATPAYKCQCTPPGKYMRWENDGYYICNNIHCQNKEHQSKIYVAPGWGKPERALLSGCKHHPIISESRDYAKLNAEQRRVRQ